MRERDSRPRYLCVLFLLLTCAAAALAQAPGQQNPNVARGLSIDQVYQVGDIDHVNVFNGNLTVQIPIGPRYPVGGKMSYGLTLAFNSKVWDFKDAFGSLVGPNQATIDEIPSRTSNAGLGWLLSMGRILYRLDPNASFANAAYESPDGTQHPFYCTLHADECPDHGCPAGLGLPGWVQGYTRDNTYLRMIVLDDSITKPKVRIEFLDGSYHDFEEDPNAISGN